MATQKKSERIATLDPTNLIQNLIDQSSHHLATLIRGLYPLVAKEIFEALKEQEAQEREREMTEGTPVTSVDSPALLMELGVTLTAMARLEVQAQRIHPQAEDKIWKHWKEAIPDSTADYLSRARLHLENIEKRLAQVLPSTGTHSKKRYVGNAKVKLKAGDGDLIRADAATKSRDIVFKKWCHAHKHGFPHGQGQYTKRQVETAMAQNSGRNLRRQKT